jgi:xanthine dehydrogenase accessory factor
MNNQALLALALRLSEKHVAYAWATVLHAVHPTSSYPGAQAIVESDGSLHGWIGGGCARPVVVQAAQEAMSSGQAKVLRISNDGSVGPAHIESHSMPCASNGTIELFIHPVLPGPLLLVLGVTPSADVACELIAHMGWRTVRGHEDHGAMCPDYALVATQGDGDDAALHMALNSTSKKVVLIASQRKARSLIEAMRLQGIAQERLELVEAPAGPDIQACTPAEIALGAVAGLVRAHRTAPITQAHPLPAYINPVCNKAIRRETALHTIEFAGVTHYFCCDGCKTKFERDPEHYVNVQHAPPAKHP